MSYTKYKGDPRIIHTKFSFTCNDCGSFVRKGEQIVYFPQSKSAKCFKCGEKDYRSFLSSAMDEDIYNGGNSNPFC